MKTADELPPILTIHQTARGQYVVRVGDLKWRPLVVAVSKLLDDATQLIVVTPNDIKVVKVGREVSPEGAVANPSRNPADLDENGLDPDGLDQETLAAIAEQEGHALPGQGEEPEIAPNGGIVTGITDAGMKVVRRKPSTRLAAGHDEPCGRCRGQGKIRITQEGGEPIETACGVCQGSGVMRLYGARR